MMSENEIIEQLKKLDGMKADERQRTLERINKSKAVHEGIEINSDMFRINAVEVNQR